MNVNYLKRIIWILCWILFFISSAAVSAAEFELRILHVNDFHGFAGPYRPLGSKDRLGGIAALAARANELSREKPTILLAAGDMIQGHNWANLSQGESVIELMNAMRFDAMVVGNHEFDFGQEILRKRIAQANFPVLGANVEGMAGLRPFAIKEIQGLRVGIIGVVTEDTPVATHPRNVSGLRFSSPAAAVTEYLPEVRSGADVVIVLSHIGHAADRRLAESVKGIDVIVGGHTHTKLERPVRIGNTTIGQAWEHGKALGVLDITVQDGRVIPGAGYLEKIKPGSGTDPNAAAIVARYKKKVDAVLNVAIGRTETDLDGQRVRLEETNLGNFVTDVMRQISGADAAILNGGSIRRSIHRGEIKVRDVYSSLPFDNYVVAVKIRGEALREALEHGLAGIEDEEGWFPQVSGVKLTYSRSGERGRRIRDVFVGSERLEAQKEYVVATNDFLAVGGDGYKAFLSATKSSGTFSAAGGAVQGGEVVYSDPGRWLRDVIAETIKEKGKISPRIEGRIIAVP